MSYLPGSVIQGTDANGVTGAVLIDANGRIKVMVDRTTVVQPVSGTFWPDVQPVSFDAALPDGAATSEDIALLVAAVTAQTAALASQAAQSAEVARAILDALERIARQLAHITEEQDP